MVDAATINQFGGNVAGSPQQVPRTLVTGAEQFGEPKIQNLDHGLIGHEIFDHDVLQRQVTVQNITFV